jgi:hypothetical protein
VNILILLILFLLCENVFYLQFKIISKTIYFKIGYFIYFNINFLFIIIFRIYIILSF